MTRDWVPDGAHTFGNNWIPRSQLYAIIDQSSAVAMAVTRGEMHE
jgi:hypothetical protein